MMWILLVVFLPALVWADATLPTYPTEYIPGDGTPVTSTNKSVCATVNITGATNVSSIVITTAGHKWVTGQTVIIASVGGNTAANGTWVVTKISATQFSLNGTTGNGVYTSGGTASCDYSNLQTALDTDAATGDVTFWLNQGETYTGTASTDAMRSGFILPTKSSTNWAVIRTWDNGALPGERTRVKQIHQPFLAKIDAVAAATARITCRERANYYWIKGVEISIAPGSAITDGIACMNEFGGVSGNPPRKWIKAITDLGGGVAQVDIDAGRMADGVFSGYHRLPVGMDITFDGCSQCASIGLTGAYNVVSNSNRVVAVTGATNAPPIVITTSGDHYWQTGQQVDIASVGGNTAANGDNRIITRISSTQFSIDGTTGNGTYTSGGTVQSQIADRLTIAATMTGAYDYNANDYAQIDRTTFPTHIVVEQVWITTPNWSGVAGNRQAINSAVNMAGEDWVLRDSHIDVCGPSGSEYGRGILMSLYGPIRAVVENNYIAACSFEIFFDSNGHILNTVPEDITVRGNTITRRSSSLPNSSDTSTEWRRTNTTVKNLVESKGGKRIRLTGNHISRGYNDDQAIMLHFTDRPNVVGSLACGGINTGVEGEGCNPALTLSDLILDYNIFSSIGQDCIDITAQQSRIGSSVEGYAGVRGDRFLIEHNLFMNCAGYPQNFRHLSLQSLQPGSAVVLIGGPKNVTVRHNTMTAPTHYGVLRPAIRHFCGPADNPANGAMLNTDGVTRTGSWTACNQSNATGNNETGVAPNLTVVDNIMWSNSTAFGPYGFTTPSGGTQVRCGRTEAFDPGTASTGVWHHNLLVGSVGTLSSTNCDMNVIPGTQVLATGSQIVANQTSMNYLNLPGHVYKLTSSSPGYQAASDGTDMGVNWDTLMSAVTRFK